MDRILGIIREGDMDLILSNEDMSTLDNQKSVCGLIIDDYFGGGGIKPMIIGVWGKSEKREWHLREDKGVVVFYLPLEHYESFKKEENYFGFFVSITSKEFHTHVLLHHLERYAQLSFSFP